MLVLRPNLGSSVRPGTSEGLTLCARLLPLSVSPPSASLSFFPSPLCPAPLPWACPPSGGPAPGARGAEPGRPLAFMDGLLRGLTVRIHGAVRGFTSGAPQVPPCGWAEGGQEETEESFL